MNTAEHAMTVIDDGALAKLIENAQRRLIVVAPGLSLPIATLLAARWRMLGAGAVSVTLEVDPEIDRLGFGDIEAVKVLEAAAAKLNTTLNTHRGLRIGVVIADEETLIYAPTPLHVEAGPRSSGPGPVKPNAIRLGTAPAVLEADLGAGPNGLKDQIIGLDKAQRSRIAEVEKDLNACPPQPVNISRLLRVYTAKIEFVELRLVGCEVSRRTIKVPSDLIGLTDEHARGLLESKFRIVDEADAGVWGEELRRIKEFIVRRFLVPLPTFGHVIEVRHKAKFELAVKTLRKMLVRARRRKCGSLQTAMDRRLEALHSALLPSVQKHPPARWRDARGRLLDDVATRLKEELADLAGTAEDLLADAHVELRYKGVTYETLNDPVFVKAARSAMPELDKLHEEQDAAPAGRL